MFFSESRINYFGPAKPDILESPRSGCDFRGKSRRSRRFCIEARAAGQVCDGMDGGAGHFFMEPAKRAMFVLDRPAKLAIFYGAREAGQEYDRKAVFYVQLIVAENGCGSKRAC